jgi:hypothetical protein
MSWMGWAAIGLIVGFAGLVVALFFMSEYQDVRKRRRRK